MRTTIPSHRNAILLMVVTTMLWSTAGVLTRHLSVAHGFEVTFWRSMFAAVFVGVTLFWRQPKTIVTTLRGAGIAGIISGLMWSIMFCCFMIALTMTTVANTLIVTSLSPLLTALFAWLFLRQPIALRTGIAIGVASLGMVWMFSTQMSHVGPKEIIGMLIALGVPVATSINFITLKKAGSHLDLIPSVLLGCLISVLVMLPLVLPIHATGHDLLILAALGFFQLGLPCMLMVVASKGLSAPEISLLALLEVVLGPIWAWWGAGEIPAQETLLGGAVVLMALIFNALVAVRTGMIAKQQSNC